MWKNNKSCISIVIAVIDDLYASSLELPFVKDINENINLEIITDINYLNDFFSKSQKVDLLIIDERIYTEIIKKQRIEVILVLCENTESFIVNNHNIEAVYKYSSVKEIFHRAVGRLGIDIKSEGTLSESGMTNIITVTSPIGGAGKTTIAMAIAIQLSEINKKVLYVNSESVQNFEWLLNTGNTVTDNFEKMLIRHDDNILNCINEAIGHVDFDYVKPFNSALISYDITEDDYIFFINKISESKLYDYIVIDTSSEFNKMNSSLIEISNKCIIVMKQDRYSEYKLRKYIDNISFSDNEKVMYVCNMYNPDKSDYIYKYNPIEFIQELTEYSSEEGLSLKDIREYGLCNTSAVVLL